MALGRLAGIALIVLVAAGAIEPSASRGVARAHSAVPSKPADYSANWCGYQINGGPFSAVSGTFDVPHLAVSSEPTSTDEWVGISGSGVDSLIQAGVTESYDPSTHVNHISAWWEALPYLAAPIGLRVRGGDRVTVTVERVTGDTWGISLTDDTNGKSFRGGIDYRVKGTSAEWIVERPASRSSGELAALGFFSPAITFSNTRLSGHQASVTEDILSEDGAVVAAPSKLTAAGFAVSRRAKSPRAG